MRSWTRVLATLEDFLLFLLLATLLLVAVAQIVLRAFFDTGLEWAEPFSRVGVLWLALLGALSAARERRHISIDLAQRYLRGRWRLLAWAAAQLTAAALCFAIAWYGWGMVALEREAPSLFYADVPSWWPMLIFPFGFALIGLRLLPHAFDPPPLEDAG